MSTEEAVRLERERTRVQKRKARLMMCGLALASLLALGTFAYSFINITNQGTRITKIERSPCQEKPSGVACARLAQRVADARVGLCQSHPAGLKCRLSVEYACATTRLAGVGCPRISTLPPNLRPRAAGRGHPVAAAGAPPNATVSPARTTGQVAPTAPPSPAASPPSGAPGAGGGHHPAPPPEPPAPAPPSAGPTGQIEHIIHGVVQTGCHATGSIGGIVHIPGCP